MRVKTSPVYPAAAAADDDSSSNSSTEDEILDTETNTTMIAADDPTTEDYHNNFTLELSLGSASASSSSSSVNHVANPVPTSSSSSFQSTSFDHFHSLNECAFVNWYKKFEKNSIPSKFIRIPDNVLSYLHDEIIILPKECNPSDDTREQQQQLQQQQQLIINNNNSNINRINFSNQFDNNRNDDSDDDDDDDGDDDDEVLCEPEFPEFSQQISDIIKTLSGSGFIKTNWHCPKDAFWITVGQTLKVKDITDVYQLLKASSIVKNDICINNRNHKEFNNRTQTTKEANDKDDEKEETHRNDEYDDANEIQHYLVIKKWQEINSGTEYRCFVKNRNLIAISPRDWPQYHEHILQQKHDIVHDIISMFKEQIKKQFSLNDFVFDVVRAAKDKVYLLDFSPFHPKYTESLAFSWKELEEINTNEDDPEFRYLSTDCGIQPNKRNNYGVPQDIIDLFSAGPSSSSSSLLDDPFSNLTDILARRVQEELNIQNSEI